MKCYSCYIFYNSVLSSQYPSQSRDIQLSVNPTSTGAKYMSSLLSPHTVAVLYINTMKTTLDFNFYFKHFYKANSFTYKVTQSVLTLHNCCVSCSLDYLKSQLGSKSRLPIPGFSDSLCIIFYYLFRDIKGTFLGSAWIHFSISAGIAGLINLPKWFETTSVSIFSQITFFVVWFFFFTKFL